MNLFSPAFLSFFQGASEHTAFANQIRSGIEVVITGLIRNQFEGNLTWVRIPPAPPYKNQEKYSFSWFFSYFRGSFSSTSSKSTLFQSGAANSVLSGFIFLLKYLFTLVVSLRCKRSRKSVTGEIRKNDSTVDDKSDKCAPILNDLDCSFRL